MISNSMKSSYCAADDTSDEDSDDDAVVAEVVEHPNTGESTSLNEPTSTEVEPHTQDEPIHDVEMGDVKKATKNDDKDSSSIDEAQIRKADSGCADEDKGNDGDNGSSLTSDKADAPNTQQEEQKDAVDDTLIDKADNGGAGDDEENDGEKGSSLTSNKVDTQQEGRKEESCSSSGNVDSDRNRTGKSTPLVSTTFNISVRVLRFPFI